METPCEMSRTITGAEISNLILDLPRRKCSAQDGLVAELLHAISDCHNICDILADMLQEYFRRPHHREGLGVWDEVEIALIPKKDIATRPQEHRGISRIPILKKLTMKYIHRMTKIHERT